MAIKLQGGLGNQMFQFAYGISQGIKQFDISLLDKGNPPRNYELGAWDLPIEIVDDPRADFGYWQSETYFDIPLVRALFNQYKDPPQLTVPPNTCFVGVRRTDYLWPERITMHGVMEADYYKKALEVVNPEHVICFSDDPEWAKENLGLDSIKTTPAADIWHMSQCDHAIIANSTFHWWGAWLGPDLKGQVVSPRRWFVDQISWIMPARWTRL